MLEYHLVRMMLIAVTWRSRPSVAEVDGWGLPDIENIIAFYFKRSFHHFSRPATIQPALQ